MSEIADALNNIAGAVMLLVTFGVLAFFSRMAFRQKSGIIFMLVAGASLMAGLYWGDQVQDVMGMSIGIVLIVYSFVSSGMALKLILKPEKKESEED